ncbi:baseplate J/gp47 family protein_gp088 [Bacillus phage vB_BceM_WH1]|nr:baseplate J/gp47 family protein_gp088 [Bacillus phage vB_BceM_WH1]
MNKLYEDILKDLLKRLEEKTGINEVNPGAVARTLMEILSERFGDVYHEILNLKLSAFISTATNQYLDLIGELLSCTRKEDESDDDYRARITKQVFVIAGANKTAVRLAALEVDGVIDVKFKEYTHGGGSFTIHIITDDLERINEILSQVEEKVDKIKAAGVYAEIATPLLIPVSIKVRVMYRSSASTEEKEVIKAHLIQDAKSYMGKLQPGETFLYADMLRTLKATSPKISDVILQSITVKDMPRFVGNISARWDERLYLQNINVE